MVARIIVGAIAVLVFGLLAGGLIQVATAKILLLAVLMSLNAAALADDSRSSTAGDPEPVPYGLQPPGSTVRALEPESLCFEFSQPEADLGQGQMGE
jgi:hypothetical protein